MKILIIVPKYAYYKITTQKNYHYHVPIGLGYIISVLKKAGHNVDSLNLNHKDGKVKELITIALNKKQYDFVATGHSGIGYQMVEKILDAVNNHKTKPKTIIGGSLITSEPVLMINSLKPDYAVIGEGEETIVELLDFIEKNKDLNRVRGIAYKSQDKKNSPKYIFTELREPIMDLDSIPFPDFEAMELNEKLDNMDSGDDLFSLMDYPRTYPIIGSRGCPFQCTFCYRILGNKYRIRSSDNIIKELEFAIKKYNINSFNLLDDLFASNKARLNEFCAKLEKLNKKYSVNLKWFCSLWVSTLDEETLLILKKAGCLGIGLGFESYSPVVLKSMKKFITPQQIDNAIKLCWKVHMPFLGNFIFGDVAETKETAKETLDYWKNHCKDQVKLFFIPPYPNSEIYQHCVREGIIKDRLDFIKNKIHHTNIINMTDKMTESEFNELKKKIFAFTARYSNYVVPFKIKKTLKKDVYDIYVVCPFCKKISVHKNHGLLSKYYYHDHPHCRNCGMRYHIASPLYKFTIEHYLALDFLRKNYLRFHDMLLKSRL